jgi:hypothetical protein
MVLGEHTQEDASFVFDCGTVGGDGHAGGEGCMAGGNVMGLSLNVDQAHAAAANGL